VEVVERILIPYPYAGEGKADEADGEADDEMMLCVL